MTGQRIGYVRVSSFDQKTDRQLVGVDVDRIFTDKASGKDTERPELAQMVTYVREGDTIVVHSMDRLARNLEDLRALVRTLTSKGVRVEFMKESLVFTAEASPMSLLLLNVMGSFAEFERALIRERQREGVAIAKAKGVYKGRKRVLTIEQTEIVRQRVAGGAKKAALARELNVSRETVHRYLRSVANVQATHRLPELLTPVGATQRAAHLSLSLEIFPHNKHMRILLLVESLEQRVLHRFQLVIGRPGAQYGLTVHYTDATDLEEKIAELLGDIAQYAEFNRCDIEADVFDDQDRRWGIGDVHELGDQA